MIARLKKFKSGGRPYVMVTAYDAPTAEMLERLGVDFILVGDSVGMVLLGYPSTVPVTMDEMIHHAKAVRRGSKKSVVIGDLPLRGIERGPAQALRSAMRYMEEARCDAVKLEWNHDALANIDLMVRHKIPVLAHIGLTPQAFSNPKEYRVQGRGAETAFELYRNAKLLEAHGVFSILLECVPFFVAKVITRAVKVPTIGIGAGPFCDGQVLVFQDIIGLYKKMTPRFIKRYGDTEAVIERSVSRFVSEVRGHRFPTARHAFGMPQAEQVLFMRRVNDGCARHRPK